ncbi:MAG: HAD hydrolase-like protein [Rheinheimera sp.]|nr:HAD hydrolase-like protein [Rheinheimera sp.]
MREFHIDASQSLMVGDKAADMHAAAAGIARKILVRSGQPLTDEDLASADEVWESLAQALQVL